MGNSSSTEINDHFIALIDKQLNGHFKSNPKPYLFDPNIVLVEQDKGIIKLPLNTYLYSTKRLYDYKTTSKILAGLFYIDPSLIENAAETIKKITENMTSYYNDLVEASEKDFDNYQSLVSGRVANTYIPNASQRINQLFAGYKSKFKPGDHEYIPPSISDIKQNAVNDANKKYPFGYKTEIPSYSSPNTEPIKELIECLTQLSKRLNGDTTIDFDGILDDIYSNKLIIEQIKNQTSALPIVNDCIKILDSFIIPDDERWLNKINKINKPTLKDIKIKEQFTDFGEFLTKPEKTMRKLIKWVYDQIPTIGGWGFGDSDSKKMIKYILLNKRDEFDYAEIKKQSALAALGTPDEARGIEQENIRLFNLIYKIWTETKALGENKKITGDENTTLTDVEKGNLVTLVNGIAAKKSDLSFYNFVRDIKNGFTTKSGGDVSGSGLLNAIVVVVLVMAIIYIFVVYGLGQSRMLGAVVSVVLVGLIHVTGNSLRCINIASLVSA